MVKKNGQKLGTPKWMKVIKWVFGAVIFLVLVTFVGFKIWVSTWQTYKNDELGFSFRYPKSWYVTPDIISKVKFDKGQFPHADFSGFIFNIESKSGSVYDSNGVYKPSPGGVEVSFYKQATPNIQIGSRPLKCVMIVKNGTEFSCVIEDFKLLYVETGSYVFQLSSPLGTTGLDSDTGLVWFLNHWIGSKIIDSFDFTKK